MKLLVCISKTPDTTAKISFTDNNTKFNSDGVQYIMNPSDEWYALVKALEVKEAKGGSVTLMHVGKSDSDTIIRKGLAIGADDAIRIDKDPADSSDVARQIADHIKEEGYDIIFVGRETIDYNGAEVGAMLAELLDLPFISYANGLTALDNSVEVSREIEGGVETVEVTGPLVVSASKGMAEQRIPNMRGIMMAKRKPLNVADPIQTSVNTSIVQFTLPEERTGCQFVDAENMDELVRLLHEEAKVI